MSVVSCHCGLCKLVLQNPKPRLSLLCGCPDCRQALKWAESQGARTPQIPPKLIYLDSDITSVEGQSFMKACQLRELASSTRVHCTQCYSIIGVDHPAYVDNVFMIFSLHCQTDFPLTIEPAACLNVENDLCVKQDEFHEIIPIFSNLESEKERTRFTSIPEVNKTFTKRIQPVVGRKFSDIIRTLGPVEILNLSPVST